MFGPLGLVMTRFMTFRGGGAVLAPRSPSPSVVAITTGRKDTADVVKNPPLLYGSSATATGTTSQFTPEEQTRHDKVL